MGSSVSVAVLRLGVDQHDELVRLARAGVAYREVAARVGCALSSVYEILGAPGDRPVDRRSGFRLSLADREEIRLGVEQRESLRSIARRLGRNVGSISRELARNGGRGAYRAWRADERALWRMRRSRASKLSLNARLGEVIETKLKERWSPQQIAHHLKVSYPHDASMQLSHETIYQSLFVQARGSLRKELTAYLRTRRTARKRQGREERRGKLIGMVNIRERPAEAADRAVPGHWEGDLERHEAL